MNLSIRILSLLTILAMAAVCLDFPAGPGSAFAQNDSGEAESSDENTDSTSDTSGNGEDEEETVATETGDVADDATHTILLMHFKGPRHIKRADQMLKNVRESSPLKDVYVVNREGHSELYLGRYNSPEDAQDDLKQARRYRIFKQAIVVTIPGKQLGPGDWNIEEVREGYYTIHVATFYDIPEQNYTGRQERAVELCRKLREKNYEAYYLHETSVSKVMVGVFPQTAIRYRRVTAKHPVTGDECIVDQPVIVNDKMKELIEYFHPFLECGNTIIIGTRRDPDTGKQVDVHQSPSPVKLPYIEEADPGL